MPTIDLDDIVPKVSRSAALRFSPLLVINGLSRKASFYWKLPQQPIKLSVLKLDGSCFQIEVTKTSTVAELKQAVEDAFSHLPKKGPGKISWLHVWGHFCLCYNDQKLVTETEYIKNYGIKDGDQLHFVRHQSINYNLRKRRQKRRCGALTQPRMSSCRSDGCEEKESNGEEDDNQENQKKEIFRKREKFKLSMLLGGWFSYSKLTSPGRRKYEGKTSKSKFTSGLLGSFRKMVRIYNKKSAFSKNGMERGLMGSK
ncbi:uncharacterized protein LOC117913376 isoform X2 [Vitis riparia]|uniref:uncharacterized protein LOC117913376 isoform X2 n=1 Tax=Vitis riparia TaxID=96939 RepID=UPI00155A3574|nr:uncharacterized protein LOC117913376 isoform X2 [Vitis riparia]